jgi:hypothetical protein
MKYVILFAAAFVLAMAIQVVGIVARADYQYLLVDKRYLMTLIGVGACGILLETYTLLKGK